jgi:hypothetical protein
VLMSRNEMWPARTAASSLLRCQSMPALQTGRRVLCQTMRWDPSWVSLVIEKAWRRPKDAAPVEIQHRRILRHTGERLRDHRRRNPAASADIVATKVLKSPPQRAAWEGAAKRRGGKEDGEAKGLLKPTSMPKLLILHTIMTRQPIRSNRKLT